jgi:hypothetical protein
MHSSSIQIPKSANARTSPLPTSRANIAPKSSIQDNEKLLSDEQKSLIQKMIDGKNVYFTGKFL